MDWEIRPLSSVGPIDFGMLRADVRRAIGGKFREFAKSPERPFETTDAFEELLVHVYYDAASGRCDFVEFGSGIARPTLQGNDLLTASFSEVRDWMIRLDPETTESPSGLESAALGIALYAPYAEEDPTRPAEGVSVFRAGYRQA